MRLNILFGGPAGSGPNILTNILGKALVGQGNYVFYSRDYQSLIRGGHNFNVLTFSDKPVYSNDSKIDILVCLDENTEKLHENKLNKKGVILKGHKENMYYAGGIFKLLGLDFLLLEKQLFEISDRFEENIKYAKQGYKEETRNVCKVLKLRQNKFFLNGNQGISDGAIKSGLDVYLAYPMTPATSVLMELAEKQIENNFFVFELENEIAVINAAVGSAITGAKTMIGTSGGGFDLMTEGLSLTGIAEVPLVIFLSQRPGPGTGVATYTGQGDLNIARHSGHGEFPRVVLAPGDPKEAEELTNQAFYFSQKYKIPSIIISDKHLGESFYTINKKSKLISVLKSTLFGRYNSYETDSEGSATEDPEIIEKNIEKRLKKGFEIKKEAEKFEQYEIYGDENSKNVVVSWGSTKGAIIDAIKDLDTHGGHTQRGTSENPKEGQDLQAGCKFIQIKYIEPFPEKIKKELENKNLILVENNSTGQLGSLITEKTGIFIENKILRYDGRPFLADELKKEIEGRLK
ncbi:2-oxoacid:acceptor oxidoreductase family protein [Candidatus Pacearchaeota archaeon]|nr:2-oxoacid:acceptor oxidoreductase family protein [Candidatus Pacearchaeota archaeon]